MLSDFDMFNSFVSTRREPRSFIHTNRQWDATGLQCEFIWWMQKERIKG